MRNPPRRLLLLVAFSTLSLMIVIITIRFNAFGLIIDIKEQASELFDFNEPTRILSRTETRWLSLQLTNLRQEMAMNPKTNSKSLPKLDILIQKLNPSQGASSASNTLELCAESYMGSKNFGWKRSEDCVDTVKFNEMITVVLVSPSLQLLQDVTSAYPGIPIVVASEKPPTLNIRKKGVASMGVPKGGMESFENYNEGMASMGIIKSGTVSSTRLGNDINNVSGKNVHMNYANRLQIKNKDDIIINEALGLYTKIVYNGTEGEFKNVTDVDGAKRIADKHIAQQNISTGDTEIETVLHRTNNNTPHSEGVASEHTTTDDPVTNIAWVRITSPTPPPGHAWNLAIRQVRTPYALVGRGLSRFPLPEEAADLRRSLAALTSVPGAGVAGGSVRNASGHWRAACYEMSLRNYALLLHPGYRYSAHECMFCDYVDGPMVVRVDTLPSMDQTLIDENSVFIDLFLRLMEHQLVISCPDVQFEGQHHITRADNSWLPLARKWTLNHLRIADSRWKFSCLDIGMSCNGARKRTDRFLMPPCCRQLLEDALAKWAHFCEEHGLQYRLDSGSVLGAVKMQGLIPWDLDGDALYLTANHTFFATEGVRRLAALNVTIDSFEAPKVRKPGETGWLPGGYFLLRIDGLYVEMWGVSSFNEDSWDPKPRDTVPTRVLHGRNWLVTPYNPGRYSRNRYGPEMLRHAQSWIQTGKASSWELYTPGRFQSCKNSHHFACLDRYPADGNLPFGSSDFP